MGTIELFFHVNGNLPEVSDRLKSLASGLEMLVAVALSIRVEILSTPLAVVGSRCKSISTISSSSQRNSSGKLACVGTCTTLDSSRGEIAVLKQF